MPEEKHQPQVFVSYSCRDLAFVEQLAADLKATGLDVWGWKVTCDRLRKSKKVI